VTNKENLSIQNVVITGASEGLGLELAKCYARCGSRVFLIARNPEKLEKAKKECEQAGASQVSVYPIDVSSFEMQRKALSQIVDQAESIHVFIANAGIGGNFHAEKDTFEEQKRVILTNYLGAVAGIELMKLQMIKQGFGTLAGVSSVAAYFGLPGASGYSASKAALSTYLQSLRVELCSLGVQVVAIEPGFIKTALTSKNEGQMPFLMEVGDAARQIYDQILSGKTEVIVPKPFCLGIKIITRLPREWIEKILGKTMKKMGRGRRVEEG
jgi:short-subunit dehydrogenase